MSEVLGSFSADSAALYIANRTCKPNELSLAFRKDGFHLVSQFLPWSEICFKSWPLNNIDCLHLVHQFKVLCPDGIHSIALIQQVYDIQ